MKLPAIRARAILVHEIADACAALAAAEQLGVAVTLASAPCGAAALGAGWWQAVTRQAAAAFPAARFVAVLDCGDRADLAQAALRQGIGDVCYRGPAIRAGKLADIAGQCGARLHRRLPPALDLTGMREREPACRDWLSGSAPIRAAG